MSNGATVKIGSITYYLDELYIIDKGYFSGNYSTGYYVGYIVNINNKESHVSVEFNFINAYNHKILDTAVRDDSKDSRWFVPVINDESREILKKTISKDIIDLIKFSCDKIGTKSIYTDAVKNIAADKDK